MSIYDDYPVETIRSILKSYFMMGKRPTQCQYHDLIDAIFDKDFFLKDIDLKCNKLLNVSAISYTDPSCQNPLFISNDVIVRNLTADSIDILNFEVSGFDVTGDLGLQKNISVSGVGIYLDNVYVSGILITPCGNSQNWCSVFETVQSLSSNWDAGYNTVFDLSSRWESAHNAVTSSSGVWSGASNTVSSLSSNWESVYGTVNTLSGDWDSVKSLSANWESTYNTVSTLSADWESSFVTVSTLSGEWETAFNTVSTLSAKWDSTFGTVSSLSARWDGNFCDKPITLDYVQPCDEEVTFGANVKIVSGAEIWTEANLPNANWGNVTMSKDGKYRVATSDSTNSYYSTDYGVTWNSSNSATTPRFLISSSNGKYVFSFEKLSQYDGESSPPFISEDYGATWLKDDDFWKEDWHTECSSSDGQYQYKVTEFPGSVLKSDDYGSTWEETNSPKRNWLFLITSSNGQYILAVREDSGDGKVLWVSSSDYGETWSSEGGLNEIYGKLDYVFMSSDGQNQMIYTNSHFSKTSNFGSSWAEDYYFRKLGFCVSNNGQYQYVIQEKCGTVYKSSDFGGTWAITNLPRSLWIDLVSSEDGKYLIAVRDKIFSGEAAAYKSSDYGETWTPISETIDAMFIGDQINFVSQDGQFQVAVEKKSTDYGNTWSNYNYPGPFGNVSIAYSSDGKYQLKVGGFSYDSTKHYYSSDYGVTWEDVLTQGSAYKKIVIDDTGRHIAMYDIMGVPMFTESINHGKDWYSPATILGIDVANFIMSSDGIYKTFALIKEDNSKRIVASVFKAQTAGNLFVQKVITTPCGNSEEWCSTYNTVSTLSSNWSEAYNNIEPLSTSLLEVRGVVEPLSSLWNSVYNTVSSLSANWDSSYNQVFSLSSNWNSSYSTLLSLSSKWVSVYNQVSSLSSEWAKSDGVFCDRDLMVRNISACNGTIELSGNLVLTESLNVSGNIVTDTGNSTEWDEAYAWGDHNTATAPVYILTTTGTPPTATVNPANGPIQVLNVSQSVTINPVTNPDTTKYHLVTLQIVMPVIKNVTWGTNAKYANSFTSPNGDELPETGVLSKNGTNTVMYEYRYGETKAVVHLIDKPEDW